MVFLEVSLLPSDGLGKRNSQHPDAPNSSGASIECVSGGWTALVRLSMVIVVNIDLLLSNEFMHGKIHTHRSIYKRKPLSVSLAVIAPIVPMHGRENRS